MKNHRLKNLIKEVANIFAKKITGGKNSPPAVIVVILFIIIFTVVCSFLDFAGTERIFPVITRMIFGETTTDISNDSTDSTTTAPPNELSEFPSNVITAEPIDAQGTPTIVDDLDSSKPINSSNTVEQTSDKTTTEEVAESTMQTPYDPESEEEEERSVTVACVPVKTLTDKNAEIFATTTFDATKVILICEADGYKATDWNMSTKDSRSWTFDADFYEANTYTISVLAYYSEEEYVKSSIEVTYPFY